MKHRQRTIEIDTEVWNSLQGLAEPFTDTPNSVLRRLLELDSSATPAQESRTRARRRVPAGSLLPESAYELPILQALVDQGGRAPAREVIAAVGEAVRERLTRLDQADLSNGGKRWENRVQFTRLRLKERGLIQSGSPRGVWEISDLGRAALEESEAS
jgi:negative regulator of replication initiation